VGGWEPGIFSAFFMKCLERPEALESFHSRFLKWPNALAGAFPEQPGAVPGHSGVWGPIRPWEQGSPGCRGWIWSNKGFGVGKDRELLSRGFVLEHFSPLSQPGGH